MAPPVISPATRWLLIVVLPALGFGAGAAAVYELIDLRSVATFALSCVLAGSASAVAFLVGGLLAAPWLPAAVDGVAVAEEQPPPARHPESSWLGPTALMLLGLGAGVVGGAAAQGRTYTYGGIDPFTRPALLCVVCAGVGLVMLLVHPRDGALVVPAARPALHRVVFRGFLCAALGGVLAGLVGLIGLKLGGLRRAGDEAALGALGLAGLGAALTAAEVAVWRAPPRWRWPALLGAGLAAAVVTALAVMFAFELSRRGDALRVTQEVLESAMKLAVDHPSAVSGLLAAVTLPFAVLGAARTGLLPYFGRSAPWPVVAQVPLAWLALALGLALTHLLVDRLDGQALWDVTSHLGGALPALLLALRLAHPLEARIAARWVLLTGGER